MTNVMFWSIPLEGMLLKVNPTEMRLERMYPDGFLGYIEYAA
jgi:hypothetical protein